MNYLLAENVSKSFGERNLFKGINFSINSGDKIALVAKNGTGKSSFIKILLGGDIPDTGKVIIQKDIKLGYLPQDPQFDGNISIFDTILNGDSDTNRLIKAYTEALEAYSLNDSNQNGLLLQDLNEKMDINNAWDFESNIQTILQKLGLNDVHQKVNQLSGGQKKRVALAKILVENPQVMILDEPTNHLDIDMIEWLEAYLQKNIDALLLVTHDRYFLNKVTKEIVELENKALFSYKGNYENYLEKKEEKDISDSSTMDKTKNLYKSELEWMRRQPKARGTKSKSRIDSFLDIEEKVKSKKDNTSLSLDVKSARQGGKILEVKQISKSYQGRKLVDHFSHVFAKGEKIGIVGVNGAGKSTFLNLLTLAIEPDAGKVVPGSTTVFGYFKQIDENFDPNQRLIENLKDDAEVIELSSGEKVNPSQFLKLFGFPPENQYTPLGKLSGGEKRRFQLVKVLLKNPNFLILDEPTNDLDLLTLNVLEDFIFNFKGCVLLVSHDRYFMDKLVDRLFIFEGNGVIKDFNGNYSDYREYLLDKAKQEKLGLTSTSNKISDTNSVPFEEIKEKKKLSFKEKKELEEISLEMEKIENEKVLIASELSSISDYQKIEELSGKIKKMESRLELITERWFELSEYE